MGDGADLSTPLSHAGEAASMEPSVHPEYSFMGSQECIQSMQRVLVTVKDPGDVARKAAAGTL